MTQPEPVGPGEIRFVRVRDPLEALDELFAELHAARADTLAFIDAHDDETLARPVPRSPWGDGTIGGMLGRNAAHQANHMHAYREGLARD